MKAAIITIGDELLIGQVVDTNSVFLSQKLETLGCKVVEKVSIADSREAILYTMSRYQNQVDLVIMTGGLGPTKDDVTKKTFVEYFNDKLVRNHEVYLHVKRLLEEFYKRPISEINELQADVPSQATILFNNSGTAPGMLIQKEQTTFVSLPGVPSEMRQIVTEKLVPYIQKNFALQNIYHHTIVTVGVGESLLAEKIAEWENQLASVGVTLAYLPQLGAVRLRLSKVGSIQEDVESIVKAEVEKVKPLISDCMVSEDETQGLVEIIIELLKKKKKTIAFAESCTGGLFTQRFAEKEGASDFLQGGAVTYATESKVSVLGVSQTTIDRYTVVSEEVAKEMALGAQSIYQSDYAISTTGNAGPTKGDSDKEVGTVCIGVATPSGVKTQTFLLGQPRSRAIELAIQKGLLMIFEELKKE